MLLTRTNPGRIVPFGNLDALMPQEHSDMLHRDALKQQTDGECVAKPTRHVSGLGVVIEDMQVRNLSMCTQDFYVRQVSPLAHHFKKVTRIAGT
jgi:hypothetical protein